MCWADDSYLSYKISDEKKVYISCSNCSSLTGLDEVIKPTDLPLLV